ncbi:MAG: STAS domain-containing protein [Gammaproteobacteria bacterium]|nr:STAS domain-containing protein [Gammaproteobacteria bacterium]NVK89044.1 STAS domain-containing protein [Gammaproteobacteria bacterium]
MTVKASFACGSELNIQSADKLKARLLKTLEKDVEQFVLNASKVERVDSAGLQLLAAFIREVVARGAVVQWQKPNDTFLNATKLLGMNSALQLSLQGGEVV